MLAGSGFYRAPLAGRPSPASDPAVIAFTENYKRPDIGWRLAKLYCEKGRSFPVTMRGEDQWVFRAYAYLRTGRADPDLTRALALGTRREWSQETDVLKALLLVDGITVDDVARHTGFPRDTVAAFERLFFNVLSRREDIMYIRNLVNPDGRLVEMFDDYLRHEPLGRMLIKAGYRNGVEDVLFMSGTGRSGLLAASANSKDVARKLEAWLMANGYIAARNGFMNQSVNSRGIQDAKVLIAAALQGGQQDDEENPLSSVGSSMESELRRHAKYHRNLQAEAKVRALDKAAPSS